VRHYTRGKDDQLSFVTIAGTAIALFTPEPYAGLSGLLSRSLRRPKSRICHQFSPNPAENYRLAADAEGRFSAWDSFGGIALHELK
jgi:hypothetical protein